MKDHPPKTKEITKNRNESRVLATIATSMHDSIMEDHPPKTREITKNRNQGGGLLTIWKLKKKTA